MSVANLRRPVAGPPRRPNGTDSISGAWTLTLLAGLLTVTALASMFLHGAAAAVCLVVGVMITLGTVPVMVMVGHARGRDDVP